MNKQRQDLLKVVGNISKLSFGVCTIVTIVILKVFSINIFHSVYLIPVAALLLRNAIIFRLNIPAVSYLLKE